MLKRIQKDVGKSNCTVIVLSIVQAYYQSKLMS